MNWWHMNWWEISLPSSLAVWPLNMVFQLLAGYEVGGKFLPVDPDALAQKAMSMLPAGAEKMGKHSRKHVWPVRSGKTSFLHRQLWHLQVKNLLIFGLFVWDMHCPCPQSPHLHIFSGTQHLLRTNRSRIGPWRLHHDDQSRGPTVEISMRGTKPQRRYIILWFMLSFMVTFLKQSSPVHRDLSENLETFGIYHHHSTQLNR